MTNMCHVILTSCHRCTIKSIVLMVVVLDKTVISVISVNVMQRVPIMDTINGLKKMTIPDQ